MWKHTIAVSAIHAEDLGEPESQSMTCSADSGHLTLTFRNHTTQPIHFNATAAELTTELMKLDSIVDVDISIWSNATKLPPSAPICIGYFLRLNILTTLTPKAINKINTLVPFLSCYNCRL